MFWAHVSNNAVKVRFYSTLCTRVSTEIFRTSTVPQSPWPQQQHISPELRPISSIYCCRSNICLIGQISHNRSNIWKIIKIFSNVWESFQIMLFFLVVMGPQIILLLISTLQQPKLAGKGRAGNEGTRIFHNHRRIGPYYPILCMRVKARLSSM